MTEYLFSSYPEDLGLTDDEIGRLHHKFNIKMRPRNSAGVVYFYCPIERLRVICFDKEIRFIRAVGFEGLSIGAFGLRDVIKWRERVPNIV